MAGYMKGFASSYTRGSLPLALGVLLGVGVMGRIARLYSKGGLERHGGQVRVTALRAEGASRFVGVVGIVGGWHGGR